MAKTLRLLKVVVQPVFVVDDGDTLAEQAAQPIVVNAAEWPDFYDRLNADIAITQAEMSKEAACNPTPSTKTSSGSTPNPTPSGGPNGHPSTNGNRKATTKNSTQPQR